MKTGNSNKETTLSRQDFLAPTSQSLDEKKESQGHNPAYGVSAHSWFAIYNRDSSSWKMSQLSLFGDSMPLSETWPRAGCLRHGIVYRLRPSAPISLATGYISSPRVPRPVACDGKGAGRLRWERINGGGMNLRDWCAWKLNMAYPPVRLVEYLMGFPEGYSNLADTELQFSLKPRSFSLNT